MTTATIVGIMLLVAASIPVGLLLAIAIKQQAQVTFTPVSAPVVSTALDVPFVELPAINRRRLEMTADRIEGVCASHKIKASVHGGTVGRHSAIFVMTFEPGHSFRQLMVLKEEIELSLGKRVLIHHQPYVRIRVFEVKS